MLTKINREIELEKSCIQYLTARIELNTRNNQLEHLDILVRDLQNSVSSIKRLEQQKRFYETATKLAQQGILTEVVRKYEAI